MEPIKIEKMKNDTDATEELRPPICPQCNTSAYVILIYTGPLGSRWFCLKDNRDIIVGP